MRNEREYKKQLKSIYTINSHPQPKLSELVADNPGFLIIDKEETYVKQVYKRGSDGFMNTVWLDDQERIVRVEKDNDAVEVEIFVYDLDGYLIEEEALRGCNTKWTKKYSYVQKQDGNKRLCKLISTQYTGDNQKIGTSVVYFDAKGNPLI